MKYYKYTLLERIGEYENSHDEIIELNDHIIPCDEAHTQSPKKTEAQTMMILMKWAAVATGSATG